LNHLVHPSLPPFGTQFPDEPEKNPPWHGGDSAVSAGDPSKKAPYADEYSTSTASATPTVVRRGQNWDVV